MVTPWEIKETPDAITITLIKGGNTAQLRCIELAVTNGAPYKTRARWLRQQALRKDVPLDIGIWMESIADTLEATRCRLQPVLE